MSCSVTFKKLKEAEASAHYWHLTTKSYARHVAFKGFYDAMRDIADEYAEQALGMDSSEVVEVPPMLAISASPEDYLQMLSMYLEMQMKGMDLIKQDVLIDAQKQVNKLRYLLTLS